MARSGNTDGREEQKDRPARRKLQFDQSPPSQPGVARVLVSLSVMAAIRPVKAVHSLASRLCASTGRVCTPTTTQACGYCCQHIAHSSTTTPTTQFPCPGTHHAHALPPTTTPPRKINRRTELDFEELRALQVAGDIALIDVRDSTERENYGGIPGSLNIPLCKIKIALQLSQEDWIREFNMEKPDLQDRNLVFYARGPNASSAAVEIAHRLGYKRSRHYTGGWEDYCQKTGLPLKKSQDKGFANYYTNNFDQYFL